MIDYECECEFCGSEDDLIDIGDIYVCEECAAEQYDCCGKCDGYFPKEDSFVLRLKDGRRWCKDCVSWETSFGKLSQDDIITN